MTDYYSYVDGHPSTTSDSPSSMYAMPVDQKSGSVYADADFAVDAYGPRFRDLQEQMLKMEISYSTPATQPTQQDTASLPSSFYYMVDDEDKYEAAGDKKTKAKNVGYVMPASSAPSYAAGDGDSFPIDIYATVNGAQEAQKHSKKVEVKTDSQYVIVTGNSKTSDTGYVDEYSAVEGKYAPYEGDDAMQKQKAMAAIKAKQARADSDRSDSEDSGGDEDSDEGGEEDSDEDYMDEEDNGNSAMPKVIQLEVTGAAFIQC